MACSALPPHRCPGPALRHQAGGTVGLSALVLERDTPGVTYRHLDKTGHRLASNAEVIYDNARIPAANLLPGAEGNDHLVINRNFAWSGGTGKP